MQPTMSGTPLNRFGLIGWICSSALCLASMPAISADFSVTSPGFYYSINGASPNPALTVERGKAYAFAINTSVGHPFEIRSVGVSNNNISSGIITWTVPMDASNYHYRCSIHGFGNLVTTVATVTSAPPPAMSIVGLSLSTNLILLSTGTNTWSVLPEFQTNLALTNWYALVVQTNRFSSGTNETICGRPSGDPIFIRIRSQPN